MTFHVSIFSSSNAGSLVLPAFKQSEDGGGCFEERANRVCRVYKAIIHVAALIR